MTLLAELVWRDYPNNSEQYEFVSLPLDVNTNMNIYRTKKAFIAAEKNDMAVYLSNSKVSPGRGVWFGKHDDLLMLQCIILEVERDYKQFLKED